MGRLTGSASQCEDMDLCGADSRHSLDHLFDKSDVASIWRSAMETERQVRAFGPGSSKEGIGIPSLKTRL